MKKTLSLVLALALCLSLSVVSFAWAPNVAYDGDGDPSGDVGTSGNGQITWDGIKTIDTTSTLVIDPIRPATTVYVPLADMGGKLAGTDVIIDDVVNTDFFKFDVDKDSNGKLVKKISVTDDKRLGSYARAAYLKIELNEMTDTDESKTDGTITFKAKADYDSYTSGKKIPMSSGSSLWTKDQEYIIDYTFWVSNIRVENDDNPDVGDRVYMDPSKNDTNTLVWGDDRAALTFESDDDARKFYCRLSTSNMSDIYAEYGDPVDADLWFYNFVNNPTVPATSKATLTLGIPWDDDDDYTPDPENCFIYELGADGYLTDVTSKFTYSEDDEEIPGWSIRTRQLGTYIVSDTELDVAVDEPETSEPADVETPTNNGKDIPNTGSSDMVNVALVAAVVSLAAAGAVAFRKVK